MASVTTAGSAGKPAGGSGGASDPSVPRVDNTDGESVLETPEATFGDGLCQGSAVYCNGKCLSADLQAEGKCTVLKLGLGQTRSLALSSTALFYTAANREILKLDLAEGKHTSLVRGLSFVQALALDAEALYFATKLPNKQGSDFDVRSIAVGGGDVTVLSPPQPNDVAAIVPLASRLVFQMGSNSEGKLLVIPKAGGAASPFGGIDQASLPVLAGETLYFSSGGKLCSTSVDAPASHTLSTGIGDGLMFVAEGDYLYEIEQGNYSRTPVAGGPRQTLQMLDSPTKLVTRLIGRTPTLVLLRQVDASDPTITHVLTMPIAGGTPTKLVTLEENELHSVVSNTTHLYLAVGTFHSGGVLRVEL
jgi:hypothetical protein